MFKFIKQYTETISGAQVYPIISLLIFFIFFVLLIGYVWKMSKESVETLSNIPLDSREKPITEEIL